MKKVYLLILTALLLSFSGDVFAVTYNTINNNSVYTWSNPLYWVGGIVPPNPCLACTINVYSSVTIDHTVDGTELDITGGNVEVFAGVELTVNTYLKFNNTTILVGSDATTPTDILLNDQVYLGGTSSIQLANAQCYINANNTDPNTGNAANTVQGPWTFFGSNPGVAGIWSEANPPIGTAAYTVTLSALGQGSQTTNYGDPYQINCNHDAVTDQVYPCTSGYVFGPAMTGTDAAKPSAGLVFLASPTLPVELVQFLAAKNADGSVKVAWATAIEVNASKYNVERSSDKGSWTQIGVVAAKGNSSITTSYMYTDRTPLAGSSFYRLKMVDLDGKFKYSPVAVVNGGNDNQALVIYSNPFVDQIRLKVNVNAAQTLTMTVTDMLGKNVISQKYNASVGDNFINLVPTGASTGMYVLRIQGNSYSQTVKIAKD